MKKFIIIVNAFSGSLERSLKTKCSVRAIIVVLYLSLHGVGGSDKEGLQHGGCITRSDNHHYSQPEHSISQVGRPLAETALNRYDPAPQTGCRGAVFGSLAGRRGRDRLTKHSAASSIRPSWKRRSSLKVSARAWRRLSEGSALSRLCWNCMKMLWGGPWGTRVSFVSQLPTGFQMALWIQPIESILASPADDWARICVHWSTSQQALAHTLPLNSSNSTT